ncbi:MAG: protein kinase domain-containing protein, partial [Ktedonobacteraceae bacterium]
AYIDGQTLEEYMQHEPGGYLSELEVLEVGIALASILEDLHLASPPVIFRDLKPANVIVTSVRTLSLVDFGIARVFTAGKKKDTTPLGSPGYAPPEQYGRAQTDCRADIYSLGATLSTLLTGCDPLELAQGELSRNPDPPSRALHQLLTAMLGQDVAQRPATIGQVYRRLAWLRLRKYWPILLREKLQRKRNAVQVWWQNEIKPLVNVWKTKIETPFAKEYMTSLGFGFILGIIGAAYYVTGTMGIYVFIGYTVILSMIFTTADAIINRTWGKWIPQFLGLLTACMLILLFVWFWHTLL